MIKVVCCCWNCDKEYKDLTMDIKADSKLVLCDCGGVVVSNSGKVKLKIVDVDGDIRK